MASRRKRAGPSNRTGRGRRTTSANWGGVETKRHAVDGSSKRQNQEGGKRERYGRTEPESGARLPAARVHEPNLFPWPTAFKMNRHPWANRHRRKGFTTDAARCSRCSRCTAAPDTPQQPRTRGEEPDERKLQADSILMRTLLPRTIGMRVSHTNHQPVSVVESRRPTGSSSVEMEARSQTHGAGHCMRNLSVTNSACWSDLI